MAAVWLRLRAEARTRWRAWLSLAVLFGVAAGGAIALPARSAAGTKPALVLRTE